MSISPKIALEIAEYYKTRDPQVRKSIILRFGKFPSSRIISLLLDAIEDEEESIRFLAFKHLIKQRAIIPLDVLERTVKNDTDTIKVEALRGLANLEDRLSQEDFLSLLDSKNKFVRLETTKLLVKKENPNLLEALVKALGDQERTIRVLAWNSLKKKRHLSIHILIKVIQNYESEKKILLYETLSLLAELSPTAKQIRPLHPFLIAILFTETNNQIRRVVKKIVTKVGGIEALEWTENNQDIEK